LRHSVVVALRLKRHLPHLALKHVLVSLRDRRLVNTALKASLGRYL